MKLIFDERFRNSGYATDNAAAPGRMEAAMAGLATEPWERVAPSPASLEQLRLAHDEAYLAKVMADPPRFEMASLAAGGAILAARLAWGGEATFACIRPPGHHAARGETWGYCTFSNVALALLVLRAEGRAKHPFLIDIDAHTGDGTRDVLKHWPEADLYNPYADDARDYLKQVKARLDALEGVDILAVSAGFDAYRLDVGRKLDTPDFEHLGQLIRQASERLCMGRRFAVLEGGYYLPDLGANVRAFCRGFAG